MTTTTVGTSRQAAALEDVQSKAGTRLLYVDNIRVFLTILVILHHLMITYAGTGSWLYTEGNPDLITSALGGWYCAIDQAFFMGLFLLISAYFVPGSYDRKGAGRFLKDRLIRLGIPLVVYSWIINPVLWYASHYQDIRMPFWSYFPSEYFGSGYLIGQGPLWFVEVLLIFSLVYVMWRRLVPSRPTDPIGPTTFPRNAVIVLFAVLLAIVTFLVRVVFVMDTYSFKPLNLQFPFFAQYIALFVVGLIAYRRNWLMSLPDNIGHRWLIIAIVLSLVYAPMMLALGVTDGQVLFKGGWHWQSLVFAAWESVFCVSMCIGLIYAFRRYLNQRGKIAGFLVPNAYTAYLIHAPVIVAVAFAVQDVALYPLLKWAVVGVVAVPLCFGLSSLIRRLPYTDRIL
ncbi:MAG: acyltransferase family protein [Anaerolineae bacterium]